MRIQTTLQAALTGVAALAAAGLVQAQTVVEDEYNHPITAAQDIVTTNTSVDGFVGTVQPDDVDYYKFRASAGDVVTVQIVGLGGSVPTSTTIALFNPANQGFTMIDQSVGTEVEPILENMRLDYDGVYTVGVTNAPRRFKHGGEIDETFWGSFEFGEYFWGDYTLTVTAAAPAAEEPVVEEPVTQEPVVEEPVVEAPAVEAISILINPNNSGPSKLNPKANYTIPVAILSNPGFAAGTIDTSTVTFGPTGDEQSLSKCDVIGKDVNGDGRVDLICHFANRKAGWNGDETSGVVKGQTVDGVSFRGSGTLNMVPAF